MHGVRLLHVGDDLGHDPGLGAGEPIREPVHEAGCQLPGRGVSEPGGLLCLPSLAEGERQLETEQLVIGESTQGGTGLLNGVREVDVGERLVPSHQPAHGEHHVGHRVGYRPGSEEGVVDRSPQMPGLDVSDLGVDGDHPSGVE